MFTSLLSKYSRFSNWKKENFQNTNENYSTHCYLLLGKILITEFGLQPHHIENIKFVSEET